MTSNTVTSTAMTSTSTTSLMSAGETKSVVQLPFGVTATASTTQWLQSCPDMDEFKKLMLKWKWTETTIGCHECGERLKRYVLVCMSLQRIRVSCGRKEMRYDEASPCGDPTKLICKSCWTLWDQGTQGDPNYRPPAWSSQLNIVDRPAPLLDGLIRDKQTGEIVGHCTGYNAKGCVGCRCLSSTQLFCSHFAERVTLSAFPNESEGGSLDPDHEFVAYEPSTSQSTAKPEGASLLF